MVELDLTKPLLRGTELKYKQAETWIEFKYEQLPNFCYYCGLIGHSEKMCLKRKQDVDGKCVLYEQFGGWLRAGSRKTDWWGNKGINERVGGTNHRKITPETSGNPNGPVEGDRRKGAEDSYQILGNVDWERGRKESGRLQLRASGEGSEGQGKENIASKGQGNEEHIMQKEENLTEKVDNQDPMILELLDEDALRQEVGRIGGSLGHDGSIEKGQGCRIPLKDCTNMEELEEDQQIKRNDVTNKG